MKTWEGEVGSGTVAEMAEGPTRGLSRGLALAPSPNFPPPQSLTRAPSSRLPLPHPATGPLLFCVVHLSTHAVQSESIFRVE